MNKPVFLHIPKTGGTYARDAIRPIIYLNHARFCNTENYLKAFSPDCIDNNLKPTGYVNNLIYEENVFDGHPIVAVIRNPFDWLVSYWYHAGGFNPRYRNTHHYDYEIAQKGFDYFLKAIADRKDGIWPSRKFLFWALFSYGSHKFIPHYLLSQENLDNDLYNLAERCGVTYCQRAKKRVGKRSDYKEVYTQELIDLVNDTWGRELDLYGYDYDRHISALNRPRIFTGIRALSKVKYDVRKDFVYNVGVRYYIEE